MWFLLIFGFPVLEIYLLFKVGAIIGVANTFFYLLASAVFGIGVVRSQGAFLMTKMQASMAQGELPANSVLHSLLLFFSGALFIFPGYISDVIGLFLLLPGSRHLVAYMMRKTFARKLRDGSVRFTSFGNFGGFGSGFSGGFGGFSQGPMRDVSPLEIDTRFEREVIDVTPIEKSSKEDE